MLSWCSIGSNFPCLGGTALVLCWETRYPDAVNKIAPSHSLLAVSRVKVLLTAEDPEYGKHFTEAEWDAITDRLEALARLLWRMSYRRAEAAHSNKAISSGVEPGYERQMAGPGAPRKN
jgi:hypothetical protein